MSISVAVTPSASMSWSAFRRVRVLVANPGSVYASTFVRGSARSSMHRTATSSACVGVEAARHAEHDLLDPGGAQRVARPLRWIAYTSAQRSSRSLVSPGRREIAPPPRCRAQRACPTKSKRVVIRRTRQRRLVVHAVDVAGHPHPVRDEPVEVHVGFDQRPVAAEPLRLGEDVAVLGDQRVSVPREVGRRLVGPRHRRRRSAEMVRADCAAQSSRR